jgi:hypothetical protein
VVDQTAGWPVETLQTPSCSFLSCSTAGTSCRASSASCCAHSLHCNFANTLYTRFRLVKDKDGVCIIGAYNTGAWYEFAHLTAQSKGGGSTGRPVTVMKLFGSTDVPIARKNMPVYPFCICVGCIGDRNMFEPGGMPATQKRESSQHRRETRRRTHWHQAQKGDMDVLCAGLCLVYNQFTTFICKFYFDLYQV